MFQFLKDLTSDQSKQQLSKHDLKMQQALSPREFKRYMKNKAKDRAQNRRLTHPEEFETPQKVNVSRNIKPAVYQEDHAVRDGVPRCPTCQSTNLTKISAGARAIDGFVYGRLSVEGRAQWRCEQCGYMW